MKIRFVSVLTVFLGLLTFSAALANPLDDQKKADFVPGEILIKFKNSSSVVQDKFFQSLTNTEGFLQGQPAQVPTRAKHGLFTHLKFKKLSKAGLLKMIRKLRATPEVEYAQPNYIYRISEAQPTTATPNDPGFPSEWGLQNIGQTVGPIQGAPDQPTREGNPGVAGTDMGMIEAWQTLTDCSSVTVAVVDTGVKTNHVDLVNNLWDGGTEFPNHGYNFVNDNNDPTDLNGHGTHVAGTIGAEGNNGIGTTGVCWKARIMAVRVLDEEGSGTSLNVANGIRFAADHGARVINMSLGGNQPDQALREAIHYAAEKGVMIVVAAGNDGTDNETTPVYPCNFEEANLICVAAHDQSAQLASFSNFGAKHVAIAAPGVNITSTWHAASTFQELDTTKWTIQNSSQGDGNGWGIFDYQANGNTIKILANPAARDGRQYQNNADDRLLAGFSFANMDRLKLGYYVSLDSEKNYDYLRVMAASGSTDLFTSPNTTQLAAYSGTSEGKFIYLEIDLTPACMAGGLRSGNCYVGAQFKSDGSGTGTGASFALPTLQGISFSDRGFNVISGTSMATPHITGLAALLMSFKPSASAAEVIKAITEGGRPLSSLTGKISSGKMANAAGALNYLR